MSITSAKYVKDESDENVSVTVTYENGEVWSVPVSGSNRHYREVEEWVADGNSIQEAD